MTKGKRVCVLVPTLYQVDWSSASLSLRWYLDQPFKADKQYSGRFQLSEFLQSKGNYGPDGCCPGPGYETIADLNKVTVRACRYRSAYLRMYRHCIANQLRNMDNKIQCMRTSTCVWLIQMVCVCVTMCKGVGLQRDVLCHAERQHGAKPTTVRTKQIPGGLRQLAGSGCASVRVTVSVS